MQRQPTDAEQGRAHVEDVVTDHASELAARYSGLFCLVGAAAIVGGSVYYCYYLKAWYVWLAYVVFSYEECAFEEAPPRSLSPAITKCLTSSAGVRSGDRRASSWRLPISTYSQSENIF